MGAGPSWVPFPRVGERCMDLALGAVGSRCERYPLEWLREQQQGWGGPAAVGGSMQGPEVARAGMGPSSGNGAVPGWREAIRAAMGRETEARLGAGVTLSRGQALCARTRVCTRVPMCTPAVLSRPLAP